jgi:hypothetical protein
MSQERLSNLFLLQIEKIQLIDVEKVIDEFNSSMSVSGWTPLSFNIINNFSK